MSFNQSRGPSFSASSDSDVRYEDYAELLSMLLPSVRKICFYDDSNRVRWMSDDIEAPELSLEVAKILLQAAGSVRDSNTANANGEMTHVATVRGPDGSIQGAIALVLARRRYGRKSGKARPDDIDTALAPVLRILGHALSGSGATALPELPPFREALRPVQPDPFVGTAARAMSAPVVLRRAVSSAVNSSSCAFGALVAAERQLTFVQRGTEQQQAQAEMRQIVESLRHPIAALTRRRNDTLVVSNSDPSWVGAADYKFAAFPVRKANGQLAALLVLFRRRHEPNFDAADCASLRDTVLRIPAHVRDQLAPLAQEPDPAHVSRNEVEHERRVSATAEPAPTEPSLEKRLRTALRNDGFDLHAQPIAPLQSSSSTERYEVLLRLRQEDSLQLPQTFLEAAEQSGLLPDIDRWVVSRLLNAIRPHIEALRAGRWEFALNVSAASLQSESFGDFIEAQLFRSAVPPQALVLEFSEYDALTHRPMFERLAPRLADLGCRIALDNCRQGLDIFLSIGRLPVHRLKIDAALTHHVTTDTRAANAVRELVEVTRDVGIETVGEQIEDETTREMLRELGIDFAQGFTIAQPRPLLESLGR